MTKVSVSPEMVDVERSDWKPVAIGLSAEAGVLVPETNNARLLSEEKVKALNTDTFVDERWNLAMRNLGPEVTRGVAREILEQGASTFGLWRLSAPEFECLVAHLVPDMEPTMSPGMKELLNYLADSNLPSAVKTRKAMQSTVVVPTQAKKSADSESWGNPFQQGSLVQRMRIFWFVFVFVVSNLWALRLLLPAPYGNQDPLRILGHWIYLARGCGMGTAVVTALLYISMARGFLTFLSNIVRTDGRICSMLDAHKELHIFFGRMLGWYAIAHCFGHCMSTVITIMQTHDSLEELDELNSILGCSNPENKSFWFWGQAHLTWPTCPITVQYKYVEEVFFMTTIGLSGVLLCILLTVVAYLSSKRARSQDFERFWYLHNVAIVLWPVLMYIHGSNAWVGVGVPLIVFTTTIPLIAYATDRVFRRVRFYMYRSMDVTIRSATVRPGKDGGARGSMVYLKVEKPPRFWRFSPGMYAFICMPEYSLGQWHPFTICSGEQDDSVHFIISALGDWTEELARRVILARDQVDHTRMQLELPKLALDGPFTAPTQTALEHEVFIAVGAGVGITPFLSLLSTIINRVRASRQQASSNNRKKVPIRVAHFFWMTRSADEFLFAKSMFAAVLHPDLSDVIVLHLHVTSREQEKDAQSFLFREALRRQSRFDRRVFMEATSGKKLASTVWKPLCPACWFHGDHQDVLWIDAVFDGASRGKEAADRQLPVVFGRPNFKVEVQQIGDAHPDHDVHIFVCGNDAIVKDLKTVATRCDEMSKAAGRRQCYEVHFERFG